MADDGKKREDRGFRPNVNFNAKKPGARSFIMTPQGVFKHEDGKLETLADAVDLFWAGVAQDPSDWTKSKTGYDYLVKHAGSADREDVRRTLGWLEMAITLRNRDPAVAAAKYLSAMPSQLLADDYARLLTIFNSRKVGMVWQVTPDLDIKPLPPAIPKFGQEAGFGLIRSVPELYEKLAMFGPEMETVVISLVEEAIRYRISLPQNLISLASSPSAKG